MNEPKYEEDLVNLGYLKKILNNELSDVDSITISKHYGSKPKPPYYAGDTWIDGTIIYTCINTRLIGTYTDSDWTTESGAKEEAERKNKVFLRQPSNYSAGDMWILQSDIDHKAGKKGEMLISTAGRNIYDEDDWINMLGYGTIRSINEVANNINDAINRLGIAKESGILTIYYSDSVPVAIQNDLWYVIETVGQYQKGKVYKYNGTTWQIISDTLIAVFDEANEARLIEDQKIQCFYSTTEPIQGLGVGDIWINTTTKALYRYNGTKWVAVYDTNISDIRTNLNSVIQRTTSIETDLGEISESVTEIETTIDTTLVTKSEFNIKTGQIEASVGRKVDEEDFTGANIILAINDDDTGSVVINGDKIDIEGKAVKFKTKTETSYIYTQQDVQKILDYLQGIRSLTPEEIELYDINGDGEVNIIDAHRINLIVINNGGKNEGSFEINPYDPKKCVTIKDYQDIIRVSFGNYGIYSREIEAKRIITDNLEVNGKNAVLQGDQSIIAASSGAKSYTVMGDLLICFGREDITPSAANTPTSITITFPKAFGLSPYVTASPISSVPGTQVTGVGCSSVSTTQFTLYLTRTNTTTTSVNWIAIGKAS